MNKKGIAFGIGIALAVLAVFTASAAADNVVYFDPDPSCAAPGETIMVTLWLNHTEGVAAFNDDVHFDPDVVNITSGTPGDLPTMWLFVHYGNFVRFGGWSSDYLNVPPGLHVLANLTFVANNSGTSTLYHTGNDLGNDHAEILPNQVWINGTFNCPCPTPETFTKELVKGWNLISLPLTNDTDMTVANIIYASLSDSYDALYKYNASAHNFVLLSSTDTMESGIGYFIHMTSTGTWTYKGMPYTSMSIDLKKGLNMIGWLNCSQSIANTNLSNSSLDYYVASWNATAALPSFETFNPVAPDVFNDFDTMERGTGYFISAKAAGTLEENCP